MSTGGKATLRYHIITFTPSGSDYGRYLSVGQMWLTGTVDPTNRKSCLAWANDWNDKEFKDTVEDGLSQHIIWLDPAEGKPDYSGEIVKNYNRLSFNNKTSTENPIDEFHGKLYGLPWDQGMTYGAALELMNAWNMNVVEAAIKKNQKRIAWAFSIKPPEGGQID